MNVRNDINATIELNATTLAHSVRYGCSGWRMSDAAWTGWAAHASGLSAPRGFSEEIGWLAREIYETLPMELEPAVYTSDRVWTEVRRGSAPCAAQGG